MNPFRALFQRLRRVSRSKISEVTEVFDRVAKGDLEARIQHIDRRTPFGRLCAKINEALDTTDAYLREASAATACMGRDEFHRPILLRGLHGTFRQNAVQINQAAFKMKGHSENLGLVQDQAEDTARNIQSVAAACEELDATTVEISAEANDCTQHAEQVVRELTGARASFSTLVETTEKLDKIVHLLDQVAFRTQLLALNATIEAAHAGEKGAGFAVVAGEVKNMSDETHEANRTISDELHEIKRLTQSASDSYQNISRLVDEFKAVTEAIDRSVAEQRNATKQISERIIHVAARSEEIAIRIQGTRHAEAGAATTPAAELALTS